MRTIWVDADACPTPIKGILFSAAERCQVPLVLVANSWLELPKSELIRLELVSSGADVADNYIVEHCAAGDLVITADIPLANRIVEKGATGLDPRGELYTEENVGERLSMRNFMEELRFAGMTEGGPGTHSPAETQEFANALDRFLHQRKH